MPGADRYSTRILTDAKAAATPAEAFGMAVGGEQQDDAELATGPKDFGGVGSGQEGETKRIVVPRGDTQR
jgi:hypothetical protein